MAQTRFNSQSVVGILKTRTLITKAHIGMSVRMFVASNGTTIPVKNKAGEYVMSRNAGEEGVGLNKTIFNLKANSDIAIRSAYTREILMDGIKAEKAGEMDEAHEHFTNYLNKVQISFALLDNHRLLSEIGTGAEIAATIVEIETENGKLLSIDPATIRIMQPIVVGKTNFDLDALLGIGMDDEEGDEDEETAELAEATPPPAPKAATATGKPAKTGTGKPAKA